MSIGMFGVRSSSCPQQFDVGDFVDMSLLALC